MADNGSSNTAIVAIVVLVILAIGLAYFFGVFGGREGQAPTTSSSTVIEKPAVTGKNKS
jgi:flagellar basal body-associated protein FliL